MVQPLRAPLFDVPGDTGVRCPVCGGRLEGVSQLALCSRCETPHHRECFEYSGRCAIFGCEGTAFGWRRGSTLQLVRVAPPALLVSPQHVPALKCVKPAGEIRIMAPCRAGAIGTGIIGGSALASLAIAACANASGDWATAANAWNELYAIFGFLCLGPSLIVVAACLAAAMFGVSVSGYMMAFLFFTLDDSQWSCDPHSRSLVLRRRFLGLTFCSKSWSTDGVRDVRVLLQGTPPRATLLVHFADGTELELADDHRGFCLGYHRTDLLAFGESLAQALDVSLEEQKPL